ncbi:hypothetical protein ABPG72_013964 [Tetrahymena utriculariae]
MDGFFKKNQTNQTFQVRKINTNLLPFNRRSNLPNNSGTSVPVQNDDQRNNNILSSQQLNSKQQPLSFLSKGISVKSNFPQNIPNEAPIKNTHFQFTNNPQSQISNNPINLNQKYTNYTHFSEKQFPSSTTTNNNNNSPTTNSTNYLIQKNDLQTKMFLNKPPEGQITMNLNQQLLVNKQPSTQNFQNPYQFDAQNQNSYSPKRQQQLFKDLQQENFNLKNKYQENDENLCQENKKLLEKVKDLESKLQDYENKEQKRSIYLIKLFKYLFINYANLQIQLEQQEQQKQQKIQRYREEIEMYRQYAYMLEQQQMEQERPNQNQDPNLDNMTYEEIINLQDSIGYVSRGMKPEDINKIKEVRFDKLRMKDQSTLCSICQCDFENNEKLKELNPCKHFYHPDCINQWLKNEKNCPVCKQFIQV